MILCIFGFSTDLFYREISWLEEDPKRRLFFIDENPNVINHPQVKIYPFDSPLQLFPIASKVAEEALFLTLKIRNKSNSPFFHLFEKELLAQHRLKTLLISDFSDFGIQAYKNGKKNLGRPYRSYEELEGSFRGIPAVIVGAGPSLEEHAHHFPGIRKKALVLAGGHAMEKIPSKPHFGAILDPSNPDFTPKYLDIPLFFQARGAPIAWKGERILFPDSHFSFLNYLSGKGRFESGFTVGNFMAQIACFMGCNPIISVGMDYCYREGRKYAFETKESDQVQDDFIEAISWIQSLAKKNKKTKFYKTSGGSNYLPEFDLGKLKPLPGLKVDEVLARTKEQRPLPFVHWEESLKKMDEVVFEHLLDPLWKLWMPLFRREFPDSDMEIHKQLFFEQVVHEYLDAD